jgi:hypothetical protein
MVVSACLSSESSWLAVGEKPIILSSLNQSQTVQVPIKEEEEEEEKNQPVGRSCSPCGFDHSDTVATTIPVWPSAHAALS